MKDVANYPESLVYDTLEKVLKVSITKKQGDKIKKSIAPSNQSNLYIRRRYSFDDNGGGYKGL